MTDKPRIYNGDIACPNCASIRNMVADTRGTGGAEYIRRRRKCLDCSARFTTYERLASSPPPELELDAALRAARALVRRLEDLSPNAPEDL